MTLHMYCITAKKANNLIAFRKKIESIYVITYKKEKLNQQIET